MCLADSRHKENCAKSFLDMFSNRYSPFPDSQSFTDSSRCTQFYQRKIHSVRIHNEATLVYHRTSYFTSFIKYGTDVLNTECTYKSNGQGQSTDSKFQSLIQFQNAEVRKYLRIIFGFIRLNHTDSLHFCLILLENIIMFSSE